MIEAIIEAEFVLDVVALFLPPATPTARAPLIRAIWPTAEPTAPEAAATTNGFAGLRLADVEQAGIGGHAGHAEHADRGRDRRDLRIDFPSPLPSEIAWVCQPAYDSTMSPSAKPGLFDAITSRPCRLPSRRRSALAEHRTAHCSCARAYRDQATARGAQQDLTRTGRRRRVFLDTEIGWLRLADGTGDENHALCGLGHAGSSGIIVFRHCERSEAIDSCQRKHGLLARRSSQ